MDNFYPKQYLDDSSYEINHNYLKEQFSDIDAILNEIKKVVKNSDYTLGSAVDELENLIAKEAMTKYGIGVGSGTDALFLSLKALNIGPGDEVITTTYTFYATIGAIVTAGAKPVFCDVGDDYNINPSEIESKITNKTKAIIPVHWAGKPCAMDEINQIAKSFNLKVIEDACHAIQGEYNGKRCGSLGDIGCFSFHPLKNLNVWGDGGIVTTNNKEIAEKIKLIRNHGLVNRDTCIEFAYNSRLDTIQAVIAKYLIEKKILENITFSRIRNSLLLDELLGDIPEMKLVERSTSLKEVFHLYMFKTSRRDELYTHLRNQNIDAKIHYPTPMHLQPAAKYLGYKLGDFPKAESLANQSISLPVHEFIDESKVLKMSKCIHSFFNF
ncbi:DegT/DnrJ/EryC1/StrS family aminotransferase [Prochlorococcus sp. AH-736-M13]|nr:DegT/DnrJ/EryC1/StrS family aminotransferase [Prochlorococcus sp. AH-736-M13]MDA9746847.1 DegT/DnrJ/EryC1/StrS family aminotransferase [Prochlorococcus sp. AH-736-M13]